MKPLFILLTTLLTLALPIGLTSELIAAYGFNTLARTASLNARDADPVRQQLLRELADDPAYRSQQIEDWTWQAQRSFNDPLPTLMPYSEQWLVQPDVAQAISFVVLAKEGRVLEVNTQREPSAHGGLIVEIFDLEGDTTQPVAAMGPNNEQLRWPVSRGGLYQVRAQSTPGSVGAFALALDEQFALEFPVDTDAPNPVRSFFGVDRDGGRRKHHGIDIFAPRDTPVLAAADGYVSRVGTSPRGGLHIWQRANDDSGKTLGTLYYAHLEETFVTAGTWVDRGTLIGSVGNSGNAITTPPHLHFGLYERYQGPKDPLPLTGPAKRQRVSIPNGHRWPVWVSINRESVNVREGPGTQHEIKTKVGRGELVAVEAASEGWLRVRTGTGERGYLSDALVGAPQDLPLVLAEASSVQASPARSSTTLVTLEAQQSVTLLGQFGSSRYVETDTGLRGWISDEEEESEADTLVEEDELAL